MISVSDWLPLLIPRSVETSKITVCVGICSFIAFRSTLSLLSPPLWGEAIACEDTVYRTILDRQSQHLCKAGFAGSKEAGHPDRNTLVRLIRGLAISVEYM